MTEAENSILRGKFDELLSMWEHYVDWEEWDESHVAQGPDRPYCKWHEDEHANMVKMPCENRRIINLMAEVRSLIDAN